MTFFRMGMVAGLLLTSTAAHAAIISVDLSADFATAIATPGRQIVGGEPSITFDVASDVFAFDPAVFGINQILFANALAANLPATGVNVIVLQDAGLFAGTAANAIAAQLTDPGAGFFIYFNTGLDLPRLVFSPNLSDNTSDLAVLARLTNLGGAAGFATLPTFTAANFSISQVPEPATLMLLGVGSAALLMRKRRGRVRPLH